MDRQYYQNNSYGTSGNDTSVSKSSENLFWKDQNTTTSKSNGDNLPNNKIIFTPMTLSLLTIIFQLMLAMGVISMISVGICVISSFFVILQALQWLSLSKSLSKFKYHITIYNSIRDCCQQCGCCAYTTLGTIRGLAIATIVFSSIEFISFTNLGGFSGVGLAKPTTGDISSSSCKSIGGGIIQYFRPVSCSEYLNTCGTSNPVSIYSCSTDNSRNYFTIWLIYNLGHVIIASIHNIIWSVGSLKLINKITADIEEEDNDDDEGNEEWRANKALLS